MERFMLYFVGVVLYIINLVALLLNSVLAAILHPMVAMRYFHSHITVDATMREYIASKANLRGYSIAKVAMLFRYTKRDIVAKTIEDTFRPQECKEVEARIRRDLGV